jgi:hypothetical protein
MQTWCLTSYESHDIERAQTGKRDRLVAEAVLQETADKGHVVANSRFGQSARFAQVRYVLLYTELSSRWLGNRCAF